MDLFYLTNSSSYENIINILKDGVISPGGGQGMSTYNNIKSKYLYFELVFPEYQRNAPGIGIYFSPKILEDYDFRYMESWEEIQNNEDFKSQDEFPNKNIVKKLENLRNQFIKSTEDDIKRTGERPVYSYQFTTPDSIPIKKYIRFVSNPIYGGPTHPLYKTKNKDYVKEKEIKEILKEKYPDAKILNNFDGYVPETYNKYPKSVVIERMIKQFEMLYRKIFKIGKKTNQNIRDKRLEEASKIIKSYDNLTVDNVPNNPKLNIVINLITRLQWNKLRDRNHLNYNDEELKKVKSLSKKLDIVKKTLQQKLESNSKNNRVNRIKINKELNSEKLKK